MRIEFETSVMHRNRNVGKVEISFDRNENDGKEEKNLNCIE